MQHYKVTDSISNELIGTFPENEAFEFDKRAYNLEEIKPPEEEPATLIPSTIDGKAVTLPILCSHILKVFTRTNALWNSNTRKAITLKRKKHEILFRTFNLYHELHI